MESKKRKIENTVKRSSNREVEKARDKKEEKENISVDLVLIESEKKNGKYSKERQQERSRESER